MEGYKSFREAVESVSSAADSWLDLSTGAWFNIDDLREMGDAYDEMTEPDGWNYFVTFEKSGEIGLASTCTREIEFLFVPKGSRYQELIAMQEKQIKEVQEELTPVVYQMVQDKLDELENDPEKFAAAFERGAEMAARNFINRAYYFEKPEGLRFTGEDSIDADATKVLRMLRTPGLIRKTAAARNELRNAPEPPVETDPQTVLKRMDYCLENRD